MANDLKRVGLVFNADGSTDFVKSLKSVNASLQENYADFKLVQAQYDKNTTSSQKLTDKLNYLNNAYDIQKTKVRALQEELDSMTSSENKDEVAITKKQTALKQAQAQLERYGTQISSVTRELEISTSKLKVFSENLSKIGDKMTTIGKRMSIVSAGVVSLGVVAKKSFDAVDEGADNVIKATGATGEAAEGLENSYKKVASSIVGDFAEIGSSLGEVNTRFGFTGDVLENCTQQFMKFAEINNVDVTSAVQLVSRAMGDASISSNEYQVVLDALSVAAQASGISIESLTGNITKYGAPMRALGYTTQESIAIFASWEKAGVNTEIAFSGMKKAISNFSAAGKDAKVEFKKTLDQIAACPDIASATTKAIEVFGAKAGPDLADAIKGGRFEFNEMLGLIESSKGVVDNTFDGLLDGSYDTDLALQNAKLTMGEIGDTLMTNLAPIIDDTTKGLQKFTNWFNKLDDSTKNTILKIVLFVVAIGPLLLVFGTMAGSVSKIIALLTSENVILGINIAKKGAVTLATKAWHLAQLGLNGVLAIGKLAIGGISTALSFLAANPIVLVIAAIAALVAGFIYLWNTNENFRNAIVNAWTFIQNIFVAFDQFLTGIFQTDWTNSFGVFGNVINAFFANISNFYNAIKQVFQGIIDFVKGVFTGDWALAWEGIKNIFGGVFNGLLAIAKAPLNGIIGLLNILIDGVNFLIKGMNKIKFDVPDWVPGIGGKTLGFNIKKIGKIPYMADGGTLLNGAAIVAEAGPELLLQQGNKTKVIPLNNNTKNHKSKNPFLNNDSNSNQAFNPTINIINNSKYISNNENSRQVRNELQRLVLKWRR